MFRQSIHNGAQVEDPDYWLRLGTPWEINRPEATYPIKMFGNVTWGAFPDGRPRREWVNTQELWAVPADQWLNQMIHFIKNVAIIGGLLFVFVTGGGHLSLDRWLRKRG